MVNILKKTVLGPPVGIFHIDQSLSVLDICFGDLTKLHSELLCPGFKLALVRRWMVLEKLSSAQVNLTLSKLHCLILCNVS